MDYSKYYSTEVAMENPIATDNSFSFSSKQSYEPIPENAVIKKKSVRIDIREINNGYIKRVCTDIHYAIKENDGDEDDRYSYREEETYMKDKPLDVLKMYV